MQFHTVQGIARNSQLLTPDKIYNIYNGFYEENVKSFFLIRELPLQRCNIICYVAIDDDLVDKI